MSDDNNGKFNLSRRKALAGIGAAGAAVGLGGIGTVAQLSDTEANEVTFTAGGIDGLIRTNGGYNGSDIDGASHVSTQTGGDGAETTFSVDFTDVKPGDYGCFNWGIEVRSNAAWVASGINVKSDLDWFNYEPEIQADPNVTSENLWRSNNDGNDGGVQFDGTPLADGEDPPASALEDGELAKNMLVLPYYDGNGYCDFFDETGFNAQTDYAVPGDFWANSEGDAGQFSSQIADGVYLGPQTVEDAAQVQALSTEEWNETTSTLMSASAPSGASVGQGYTMLAGALADGGNTGDNTQPYSALQPGSNLHFGYDWHLPFETGNEIQGDKLELEFTFQFLQERHTTAPDFDGYTPENTSNSS